MVKIKFHILLPSIAGLFFKVTHFRPWSANRERPWVNLIHELRMAMREDSCVSGLSRRDYRVVCIKKLIRADIKGRVQW